MAETLSIMEFIEKLMSDGGLRALFANDPDAVLEDHGLENLSAADVDDALVLVDDSQTADFSRDFSSNSQFDLSNTVGSRNSGNDDDNDSDGGGHRDAVEHLSRFITNNFVDDRDTNVDNSINQQIDNRGGEFDQDIDIDSNVASGDGAVSADDIEDSNVVTGDDNQVGDGNVRGDGNVVGDGNEAVTGDDNTTSFGDGDANSSNIGGDVTIGAGGGFATGGDVDIDNSNNSINDSLNDNSDNSLDNVGNTTIDQSVNDSGNTDTDIDIEDSFQDNDDRSDSSSTSIRDTGDVDIDN